MTRSRRAGAPSAPALSLLLALAIPATAAAGSEEGISAVEIARPLPPPVVEGIASAVADEMSRMGIPALSLALGDGGELRLAAGYGYADVENAVPAGPDTVYRLASVSKPMTAVAALQLFEKGRLNLDAPAWSYCPSYPTKPWTLTVRELLCHQGGVRHYRPGEPPLTRHCGTIAEGLELFKDDPLVFEPGTAVLYSTYGYSLLGCVVEGAAGRSFPEVLRSEIFGPAGMTRTQLDEARALVPQRASGYVRNASGELLNSALTDTSCKVPGGGLCGTAPDVVRFGLALLGGKLLDRPTLQRMLTRQRLRNGRVTGFGLGITLSVHGGKREAWHVGGQERVSTLLYMRPDSGLVIGVLTNLEGVGGSLLRLARRIADLTSADLVIR